MSYGEALQWFDFIRRRGLNHTDRLLATLCMQVNNALGGKAKLRDFLPKGEPEPQQHAGDISTVFNILAGAASND